MAGKAFMRGFRAASSRRANCRCDLRTLQTCKDRRQNRPDPRAGLGQIGGGGMLRSFAGVVIAVAVILSGTRVGQTQTSARPLTDITMALDFVILGRHAPWYVAQAKGYYREEGINAKFIAGRGTGHVLSSLESGVAQFGRPDVPGLALARAKDTKVKIVAVVYQKSPYAIFSLNPGANVTSAKALAGLELGSGPETFVPQVIQAFMKLKGLDPRSVKFTNISPAARIPMLVAGKVPAIHLFTLSEPGIKKAATDATVKMYVPGDDGLEMYSLGIGVTDE